MDCNFCHKLIPNVCMYYLIEFWGVVLFLFLQYWTWQTERNFKTWLEPKYFTLPVWSSWPPWRNVPLVLRSWADTESNKKYRWRSFQLQVVSSIKSWAASKWVIWMNGSLQTFTCSRYYWFTTTLPFYSNCGQRNTISLTWSTIF